MNKTVRSCAFTGLSYNRLFRMLGALVMVVFIMGNASDSLSGCGRDTLISTDMDVQIEKMPELIAGADPQYPRAAARMGIEGTVVCDIIVDERGYVENAAIAHSAHHLLDSSVLQAVRQFRFSPAQMQGEPVAVQILYEKSFSLQSLLNGISRHINLTGTIMEYGTGKPVAGAVITVGFRSPDADTSLPVPFHTYIRYIGTLQGQCEYEGTIVTTTDTRGVFSFCCIPQGPITVTIGSAGYQEYVVHDTITGTQCMKTVYSILRAQDTHYEVVVYGKAGQETAGIIHHRMNAAEVKTVAGFAGDGLKVIQAFPGVAKPTMNGPDIMVRGSDTYDSKFYLDGVEVPILFHYGMKSTYNAEGLESVELIPGGFSAKYGNAIGGVIEMKSRESMASRNTEEQKRTTWNRGRGGVDVNVVDGSLSYEAPVTKGTAFLATARRSILGEGISYAADHMKDRLIMTSVPYYNDYFLRFDKKISGMQHFHLTLFGVQEQLKLLVPDILNKKDLGAVTRQLDYKASFSMAMMGWDAYFGSNISNTARCAVTMGDNHVRGMDAIANDIKYTVGYCRDELKVMVSPNISLYSGVDMEFGPARMSIGSSGDIPENVGIHPERWVFADIAGYVHGELKPMPSVTINPGIRYDYYPGLTYKGSWLPAFREYHRINNTTCLPGDISLRLSGKYRFSGRHAFMASAGNYNKSPKQLAVPIYRWYCNPDIAASRAVHYTAGHEWRISKLINAQIQVYNNRQWRLPSLSTPSEIAHGAGLISARGMKKARGLELLVRHDQTERCLGWIAYTLSRCVEYDFDLNKFIPYDKDQTHNLIAVTTWFLPHGWNAGFKFQYATGNPKTPVSGYEYDELKHCNTLCYGEKNSSRLPPSITLDLRIDKKFVFKKWTTTVYLDLLNAGYFLYKSPQSTVMDFIDINKPFDLSEQKPNYRYLYMYPIPSLGIQCRF